MAQANKEYLSSSGSNPSGSVAAQESSPAFAETLADRMSEEPPSPIAALSMLADIAECVGALDEGGTQHTELSPSTILFTREGKISIRSYTLGQTEGTIAFANPKYVSPDAFRKGLADRDATLRDVYILGFIFYEFLLGKALFRGQFSVIRGPADWIAWHANDAAQAKPLTELLPAFPLAIAQIVEGMIEKDLEKRTKDLIKVAYRLRSATERTVVYEEPHKITPSSPSNATDTPTPETETELSQLGQEVGVKVSDFAQKAYAVCRKLIHQIQRRVKVKSPGAVRTARPLDLGRLFQPITRISWGRASMVAGLIVGLAVLALWLWRFGSGSSPSSASVVPMAIETDSGEMVRVEGREIAVGPNTINPNDARKRTAYRESFYIDRFEVSNSSFKRFCLSTGRTCPDYLLGPEYTKHADDPILDVSVDDVRAYAEWAGKWLPSVAEWRDAMLSERGWMGIRPNQTAMSAGHSVLEWTDSDFRNSLGKADAGVKVLKADLTTNQLTFLPGSASRKQSGVGFRCVSGMHILETPHFLGQLKLPAAQHTAPSSPPIPDQPVSAATTPQQQSNAPISDTKSDSSHDTLTSAPNNNGHSAEPQEGIKAQANAAPEGNAPTAVPARVPFTVSANVGDAAVLINGKPTNLSLVNGSRRLSLPPGKYHVAVSRDTYEAPPTQQIELRAGDNRTQALLFSLSPIRRNAILSVNSALAGAEVLVDNDHIGTVGPSGVLTADVRPGNHSVALRKQNYEALNRAFEFSAGKTVALSGADMKPFGAIVLKVSPANAHITLHRAGDSQNLAVPNATTYSAPPGDYTISAGSEKHTTRKEAVSIAPGQILNVGWELTVAPTAAPIIKTPKSLFEDSIAWRVDPSGWWVHDGKGYTFLRATEGTFAWEIRRDPSKGGIFRSKTKRVTFVAEYKGEGDRIVYMLDPHFLIKRVYSGGKLREERKSEIADGAFSLFVQMTPHAVLLQSSASKVLDSIPRTGEPGKFGFLDEVWLTAQ